MTIVLVLIYIFTITFIYCCLKVSSNISRQEEIEDIQRIIDKQ